jgi:octaprenyl-diphosphate synthase
MLELNPSSKSALQGIYHFLRDEISLLDSLIEGYFIDHQELISEISCHMISSKGKRIRPMLTLLCSKMLGYTGKNHIKLAGAIELIHIATLLHDDVIDQGKTRRSKATANSIWDNKSSILCGDFFFSQSFKMMVSTKSLPSLELLSAIASQIVEGEVMQLVNLQKQILISKEHYFKTIDYKTAKLFAGSCQVAALIMPNLELDAYSKLNKFGSSFGLAYQIKDDMLDYFASESSKNKAQDFQEGKITLPIITLHELANDTEKQLIQDLFANQANRTEQNFDNIVNLLNFYKVKDLLTETVNQLSKEAQNALNSISAENRAKDLLLELVVSIFYI